MKPIVPRSEARYKPALPGAVSRRLGGTCAVRQTGPAGVCYWPHDLNGDTMGPEENLGMARGDLS